MKSLTEFITENMISEADEAKVYVVKDEGTGEIVSVSDSEKEAKKIADDYKKENSDNKPKIEIGKKSEYVN